MVKILYHADEAFRDQISENNIAEQFSPGPADWRPSEGTYCGRRFREEILPSAHKSTQEKGGGERVEVELAGAYSSVAFQEEAFGGLARVPEISFHKIDNRLDAELPVNIRKFCHDVIFRHLDRAKYHRSIPGERPMLAEARLLLFGEADGGRLCPAARRSRQGVVDEGFTSASLRFSISSPRTSIAAFTPETSSAT